MAETVLSLREQFFNQDPAKLYPAKYFTGSTLTMMNRTKPVLHVLGSCVDIMFIVEF